MSVHGSRKPRRKDHRRNGRDLWGHFVPEHNIGGPDVRLFDRVEPVVPEQIKTVHERIKSADDLRALSRDGLEQEANLILYGTPMIVEEAMERQIFRCLYVPRNLNRELVYVEPKHTVFKYTRDGLPGYQKICVKCDRPMNRYSGTMCRFCYLLKSRLRFYEAQQGAVWLEGQMYGGWEGEGRVGIQMPQTEWWDDTEMPTYRYIGNAKWSPRANFGS